MIRLEVPEIIGGGIILIQVDTFKYAGCSRVQIRALNSFLFLDGKLFVLRNHVLRSSTVNTADAVLHVLITANLPSNRHNRLCASETFRPASR